MDNCITLEPYFALDIPYQVILPSPNIPSAMAKAERGCKQSKQKFMRFLLQSHFVFIWEHRSSPISRLHPDCQGHNSGERFQCSDSEISHSFGNIKKNKEPNHRQHTVQQSDSSGPKEASGILPLNKLKCNSSRNCARTCVSEVIKNHLSRMMGIYFPWGRNAGAA